MSVTKENLEKWLEIFGDLIETNKAYLSDLDTPIGDGDHGNNMTSIDMAGISLTVFELAETKWLDYLNYEVDTIAW